MFVNFDEVLSKYGTDRMKLSKLPIYFLLILRMIVINDRLTFVSKSIIIDVYVLDMYIYEE